MITTGLKQELIAVLTAAKNGFTDWERADRLVTTLKSELPYFEITSISRNDLQDCLTDDEIALLDDTDMERIADKMGCAYCDNGYWIDLDICAKHVLESKKEVRNE